MSSGLDAEPWIDGRDLIGYRVLTDDGVALGTVKRCVDALTVEVTGWERIRRTRRDVPLEVFLRVDRANERAHLALSHDDFERLHVDHRDDARDLLVDP